MGCVAPWRPRAGRHQEDAAAYVPQSLLHGWPVSHQVSALRRAPAATPLTVRSPPATRSSSSSVNGRASWRARIRGVLGSFSLRESDAMLFSNHLAVALWVDVM